MSDGAPSGNLISQSDLGAARKLRQDAWDATAAAIDAANAIRKRLEAGAAVEPGPLTFDRETGSVSG